MAAGGLAVGDEGPFKARQRPVVSDIDKPAKIVHARHDNIGGGGDLIQIITHDLDADGKRTARSLLLLGDAEIGTGKAGNQPPHAVHQRCCRIALIPVRKDRADGANRITRHLMPAASRPERARIEILHPVHRKDRCLGRIHQRVAFLRRQITARQNLHACLLGLDIREKSRAVPCHEINAEAAEDDADHRHHGDYGIPDRLFQGPAIASRCGGRNHALRHRLLADDAAKYRNEDQRHEQRCNQHAHHRDRQIFHELADNAGPEQQRQEDHQRCYGRGDDRPRHALRALQIGVAAACAHGNPAVSIFSGDNHPVDKHAGNKDQREQHDDVHRHAHQVENADPDKETSRNGQPDQCRVANAKNTQHHDHHDQHGGGNIVAKIAQKIAHILGIIKQVGDLDALADFRRLLVDHRARGLDNLDNVGADTLADIQHHGRLAIHPRPALGLAEGSPDHRNIAKGDGCAVTRLNRHLHQIVDGFDDARNLYRQAAATIIDGTRRHQLVVAADEPDHRRRVEPVGLDGRRVQQNFENLFTVSANLDLEHTFESFDLVLDLARGENHFTLRNRAIERSRQDREERQVDLGHRRLVGLARQVRLRVVHRLPHIIKDAVDILAGIEFQRNRRITLRGHRRHLVETLNRTQVLFQRLYQQPFGILGRNAFISDRHIGNRNIDIRGRFLGNIQIGDVTETA